ncbi:MAG: tetratricopeptide repeat protein [Nostoc sp.]
MAGRGISYLILKQYDKALVDFNRAIDLKSDSNRLILNINNMG